MPAQFRAGEKGGEAHENSHHHCSIRGGGSPRYRNSALAAQNAA
jgi:hypothetical protein